MVRFVDLGASIARRGRLGFRGARDTRRSGGRRRLGRNNDINRRLAIEPLELRTLLAAEIQVVAEVLFVPPGERVRWEMFVNGVPEGYMGVEYVELELGGNAPIDTYIPPDAAQTVFDGNVADDRRFAITFGVNQTTFPVSLGTVSGIIPLNASAGEIYDLVVDLGSLVALQGPAPGIPIPFKDSTPGSVTVAGPTNNVTVVNVGGVLTITGDAQDNSVLVDLPDGPRPAVVIVTGTGGTTVNGSLSATFRNVTDVIVNTGNGNDAITVAGAVSNVDTFNLLGGDGDDTFDTTMVLGGTAIINPGFGNDRFLGGAADEQLIVNHGNGTDVIDAGGGANSLQVNGNSNGGDNFSLTADGSRLDIDIRRIDLAPVTFLDVSGIQTVEVNGNGGDDRFELGDLSKTGVQVLQLKGGDGDDDFIIKQGFMSGGPPGPQGDFDGGEGLDTINLKNLSSPPSVNLIDGAGTIDGVGEVRSIENVIGGAAEQNAFLGAHLFYNNSGFDGNGAAVTQDDFAAIATDKVPLFFGGTGTFENISSYTRGINGIFMDFTDLPDDGEGIDVDDFRFQIGDDDFPAMWKDGPEPTSVGVLPNAGPGGADRVYVTFADLAVSRAWVVVSILANDVTRLATDAVFFFGSAPGETGAGFAPGFIGADAADLQSVVLNLTPLQAGFSEPVDEPNDINRDLRVDAFDLRDVALNLAPIQINPIQPQDGRATATVAPRLADDLSPSDDRAEHVLAPSAEPAMAKSLADERVGGEKETGRDLAFAAIGKAPRGSLIGRIRELVEDPLLF